MIRDNDLIRLTYTTKRHRSGTSMRTSKRDEVLDLVPGTIRIITYCTETGSNGWTEKVLFMLITLS